MNYKALHNYFKYSDESLGFNYKKHVAFVVGDQLAKASKQG